MRRKDSHDGQGRGGRRGEWAQAVVRQVGRVETGGETGDASPLPVFLFPSELLFYSEQRSSHRRVITVYNPYSFSLSFKSQYLSVCSPVCLSAHLSVYPADCLCTCLSLQCCVQLPLSTEWWRLRAASGQNPVLICEYTEFFFTSTKYTTVKL